MHKRIVFLLCALLAVSTLALAQTQVTRILSASDITAMINHGDAIADELDAVEVPVDWTAAAFMNMEETVHPADLQLVRSRLGELEFMAEE